MDNYLERYMQRQDDHDREQEQRYMNSSELEKTLEELAAEVERRNDEINRKLQAGIDPYNAGLLKEIEDMRTIETAFRRLFKKFNWS